MIKWLKEILQIQDMGKMSVSELKELSRKASELVKIKNDKIIRDQVFLVTEPIEKLKYSRSKSRHEIKVYDVNKVNRFFDEDTAYRYPNEIENKKLLKDGVMKFVDVTILIQYLNQEKI